MIFHNVYSAFFCFVSTEDGRVPYVEAKGLKIGPSEFSTPFPRARISIPKGSNFQTLFLLLCKKKGADFFLVLFPISFCRIHGIRNKRWQKRKETKTSKKNSELCTFPKPEGPVDRLYGAFRKVLELGRVPEIRSLSSNSLLMPLK